MNSYYNFHFKRAKIELQSFFQGHGADKDRRGLIAKYPAMESQSV